MILTDAQLAALGFASVGTDVRIHPSVTFFGCEHIRIGNNVRIDCQGVVTASAAGQVCIGDHVHLAAGVYLFGSGGGIVLEDFTGLSSRVALYTSSDDYTQGSLTNPTVDERFRRLITGRVILRRHAIVGAGSVIMPGVELGVGASVGALSFVSRSVPEFAIMHGNPARRIGERKRCLLDMEAEFLAAIPPRAP